MTLKRRAVYRSRAAVAARIGVALEMRVANCSALAAAARVGWQRYYEWFIAPMQLPQLGWGWQRYYESAAVLCVKPLIYCFIQWITNPLNEGVNKTWLLNNPIVSDFSPK